MFTRTSVHWAERIVATSSCSGVAKFERTVGVGIGRLQPPHDRGGVAFGVGGRNHAEPGGWRYYESANLSGRVNCPESSSEACQLSRDRRTCQVGATRTSCAQGSPIGAQPIGAKQRPGIGGRLRGERLDARSRELPPARRPCAPGGPARCACRAAGRATGRGCRFRSAMRSGGIVAATARSSSDFLNVTMPAKLM